MNRIFIDTGFIIALINKRDQYHRKASELADRFEGYPLLTTDAVLLEIGNALASNYKQQAVEFIEKSLASDEVEVVKLNSHLFLQALRLYKAYQDKEWGLVDCISFVVMREVGINQAVVLKM